MDIAPTLDDGDEGEQRPAAAGNLLRTLTGPQVSVALGIGILLAVLANRVATPELVDSQARTDILGVIASGGLVTNGVYLLVRVLSWPATLSLAVAAQKGLLLCLRKKNSAVGCGSAVESCS